MSYTPTTDQVRDGYSIDPEGEYRDPINASANRRWAAHAFDRWLADHDAEILSRGTDYEPIQSTAFERWLDAHDAALLEAQSVAELDRRWLDAVAGYRLKVVAERDAARATIAEALARLEENEDRQVAIAILSHGTHQRYDAETK